MSSLGSAVINKSGKKIAPKAPLQRRRPAEKAPSPSPPVAESIQPTQDDGTVPTANVFVLLPEPQQDRQNENDAEAQRSTDDQSNLARPLETTHDSSAAPGTAPAVHDARPSKRRRIDKQTPAEGTSSGSRRSTRISHAVEEGPAESTVLEGSSDARNADMSSKTAASARGGARKKGERQRHGQPTSQTAVTNGATSTISPPTDNPQNIRLELNEQAQQTSATSRNDERLGAQRPSKESTRPSRRQKAQKALDDNQNHQETPGVSNGDAPTASGVGDAPGATRKRGRKRAEPASSQADSTSPTEPSAALDQAQIVADIKKTRRSRKGAAKPSEAGRGTDGSAASNPAEASSRDRDLREGSNVTTGTGRSKGRPRAATPEDAAEATIDPTATTMWDLTKGSRMGKKSKLETAFQGIDWAAVKRRKHEAELRAAENPPDNTTAPGENEVVEARLNRAGGENSTAASTGPQLKLVNGRMVIDNSSLVVDRHAEAAAAAEAAEGAPEEYEEDDLTTQVNSNSWIYSNRRDPAERVALNVKSKKWSDADTDEFYAALRMFGTDFFIISKMFPGKTRRHIKLKFVREERLDPDRVKAALLGEKVPMDLAHFERQTGREEGYYKNPDELAQELKDAEESQREQIRKEREDQEEAVKRKQEAAKARQAKNAKEKRENRKKAKDKSGGDADGEEVAADADEAAAATPAPPATASDAEPTVGGAPAEVAA